MPPSRNLSAGIFRTILQVVWNVGYSSDTETSDWNSTITPDWILSHGVYSAYSSIFTQIKVHRMVARYLPSIPENQTAGTYVFMFTDDDELAHGTLTTYTYSGLVGAPGTVVRRAGQTAKLTWYPTEPNDRNWLSIGGKHEYAQIAIQAYAKTFELPDTSSTPSGTPVMHAINSMISGVIIVDIDISFRGKYNTTVANPVPRECECLKCIRLSLRKLRTLSSKAKMSLSQMALDDDSSD